MRLKLLELKKNALETRKIWKNLPQGWEDIEGILYYHKLFYVPEIICSKLISHHYDDMLTDYFEIKTTRVLVTRKYFWPTFW